MPGGAVHLHLDPPRPALEIPLLAPEPRHAIGGDQSTGLQSQTPIAAWDDPVAKSSGIPRCGMKTRL